MPIGKRRGHAALPCLGEIKAAGIEKLGVMAEQPQGQAEAGSGPAAAPARQGGRRQPAVR